MPEQPEGVMRLRNALWWGWNSDIVKRDTTVLGNAVPVFIVYGDQDKVATTLPLSIAELYIAIQGEKKLMFKVTCTGHYMPWESRFRDLHLISFQWLKGTPVLGQMKGSYLLKSGNVIQPLQ